MKTETPSIYSVPPLTDLRVLSPLSWVRREQDLQRAQYGEENHPPHKYHGLFLDGAAVLAEVLIKARLEKFSAKEEYWRYLEYALIQIAALCVSWAEAIRRERGAEVLPANEPAPFAGNE